jgi:prepilin-type N-terminal cleavage/methylation domain-containing protein
MSSLRIESRAARRGFTMIEMLVVIAIIAILAALLFPTIAAVRNNAQKTSCMSNLHAIVQGMEMYKDDWRVYPEVLYGYNPASSGNCSGPGTSSDLLTEMRLYPNYVKDIKVFTCPSAPYKTTDRTVRTATNMVTGAPQGPTTANAQPFCMWQWDSYDYQFRPANPNLPSASAQTEEHYSRQWLIPGNPPNPLAADRRQLIFREPPDSTIVTWCIYHAERDQAGNPVKGNAMVAFKDGRVQAIPVQNFLNWGASPAPWQTLPKP